MIVLALIVGISAPVFVKKTQNIHKKTIQNSLRSGSNVDKITGCRISFRGKCIFCENICALNQYQDKDNCECKNCSSVPIYGAACKSCTKTHCRYCEAGFGYYLGNDNNYAKVEDKFRGSCLGGQTHPACEKKVTDMKKFCSGPCQKGYFSNGKVPCESCESGYYQNEEKNPPARFVKLDINAQNTGILK